MPELPQKKVGIIACSGEEIPEGLVSRLAALKVLEKQRPGDTVTICLPLFLAGGEGDRAFAKFYPTIAIDGCEKRCAYRGTEKYSNTPAASIVITDLIKENGLEAPKGLRRLNEAGQQAVDLAAAQIAEQVDKLLGKKWSRKDGQFNEPEPQEEVVATCSCGSGIPIQKLQVNGSEMTLVALPLIFEKFRAENKMPGEDVTREMMEMVKVYNFIKSSQEEELLSALGQEYERYCEKLENKA